MSTTSLKSEGHVLADTLNQKQLLNKGELEKFSRKLESSGIGPLKSGPIEIFQVNVGKMCNQTCKHCHVDAGPDRKEIMTRETMQQCLDVLSHHDIPMVDITGGAPELNPHFRWFVEELRKRGKHVMNRCNLTILLANKKFHDLPEFFAKHGVEIVASLPHYAALRTDRQRGEGAFDKSVKAMQMLNAVGYGQPDSQLKLHLVYNPTGAILPGPQKALEADYKRELKSHFDIVFNDLYVITNMPISRFLDYLIVSGNYEAYMQKLIDAFNPDAAKAVMCRNTISIGWDGTVYDCDFNQMLDMTVNGKHTHISNVDFEALAQREIVVGQHCYGCTAGLGSSCGGQTA
ncbi:MAG: arsenosugar biosynthesis radical SAM protein ArsS [Flavobacteriales bacterium]|nr:arsenosugar biosynthesis radical SAM protein ArsS [Flavobacteriales bacterium]